MNQQTRTSLGITSDSRSKPYCMLGAGKLASAVWKTGDQPAGWRYRFNCFRMPFGTGRVSQLFRPADLTDLVKLCQVLAATLAEDGCIPPAERAALHQLAAQLDRITTDEE
jgi:hypothetical protein